VGIVGVQADGESYEPITFSEDGRLLVFTSKAANLVADDTNGCADIFVTRNALHTP